MSQIWIVPNSIHPIVPYSVCLSTVTRLNYHVGQNGQGHGGGEYQVRNSWHPPLEMYIWCVYANIFTQQSEPFNSEENIILLF